MSRAPVPQVLILGAGYAGLMACARLLRSRVPMKLVVVSARPVFEQRIRLHEVLCGGKVTAPGLAALLSRRGVEFRPGRVSRMVLPEKQVELEDGSRLPYDGLVISLGSVPACAVPGSREHAVQLTGLEAMRGTMRRIMALPEEAAPLTVLGGGLTALELAAELAERFPRRSVRLVSVRQPGHDLQPDARQRLQGIICGLGVEHRQGRILSVGPDRLLLADGEALEYGICIDATGFRASPVLAAVPAPRDTLGRLQVDACLRLPGFPGVYVAGDAACVEGYGDKLRMACATAMPMGVQAGQNLAAELAGKEPLPLDFGYFARFISLGRENGLTQFVDRADRPLARVVSGRRAAWYKEWICRMTLAMIRWELLTGLPLYAWPRRGVRLLEQPE
jgi:NADH dehydrogenase